MTSNARTLLGLCIGMALAGAAAVASAQSQTAAPTAQAQTTTAEEQKTMPPQDSEWKRLDADGDGRISPVESDKDSAFGLRFDEMDTDDDGFVSSAEYIASSGKTMPPTSQGAEHAAEHSAVAARDTFSGLDKDKDGRISSTEADADTGFDAGFTAMDANGDGFVSDTEYRAQAKATGKTEGKPDTP